MLADDLIGGHSDAQPEPEHGMDLAYVAHTESCALLLDEDGICRWIVPRATATEQLIATSKRCIGARFVASLDPDVEGFLVHEPRVGSQLLFGMMIEDRFALVRVGPLLRFDTMNATTRVEVLDADEIPPAATERDFSRNTSSAAPAIPAPTESNATTSEGDAADESGERPATIELPAATAATATTEADEDDLTLDRNAAAKLDAELDELLPLTAELPATHGVPELVDVRIADDSDDVAALTASKTLPSAERPEIRPGAPTPVMIDLDNDPNALTNLFDDDDVTNMFARMTDLTDLTDDVEEIVTRNVTASYIAPPPPAVPAPPASVRESGFAIRAAAPAPVSATPVPLPPPTRRDMEGEETSPFSRVVYEWAADQQDAASTSRLPLPGRGILPRSVPRSQVRR